MVFYKVYIGYIGGYFIFFKIFYKVFYRVFHFVKKRYEIINIIRTMYLNGLPIFLLFLGQYLK